MNFLKKQQGFNFLEVLIGLFLLNVFLCGLIKIQIFSISASYQSYLKTIAITQAKNLISLLTIKKYTKIAISNLLSQWEQNTKKLLPNAKSNYDCNSTQCQITIEWKFKNKEKISIKEKI